MTPREDNIYAKARKATSLSQQSWAEALGVSVQAVRGYEAGAMMPADDIVLQMADLSGLQILGTKHLRLKSAVANCTTAARRIWLICPAGLTPWRSTPKQIL